MAVSTLKGISFPFRKGPNGFPEPSRGSEVVVQNVIALIETADQEVPMGKGIGTRIREFVLESSGPILAARVAQEIRSVIRSKEPRMTVLSVTNQEKITRQGVVQVVIIEYEVADQEGSISTPIGRGAS